MLPKFFISEAVRFDVVSERAYRTEGYMCLLRCDCASQGPERRGGKLAFSCNRGPVLS